MNSLASLNSQVLKVGVDVGTLQDKYVDCIVFRKLLDFINDLGSPGQANDISTVLLTARALRLWVSGNEGKFKSSQAIKQGLEALTTELGGMK